MARTTRPADEPQAHDEKPVDEPQAPTEKAGAPEPEKAVDKPAEAAAPAAVETRTVVMKGQISGTRDGKDWPAPGETIDLPADEAATLIRNGMAAPAQAASADDTPPDLPGGDTAEQTGGSIRAAEAADS